MTRSSFVQRLLPAPRGGGFAMEGHWVWCGSVIRAEDGRYHMFASVWTKALPFWPCWVTDSQVVRAVADRPEGPYRFEQVVLPPRGKGWWDGRMTHNPTIHRSGDWYLLFYTGTTYDGPDTSERPPDPWGAGRNAQARANQRIGLAIARSVEGPWQRPDQPLLEPRAGQWDGLMTTNPAPCIRPDGSILLVYKSAADQRDLLRLGVASAPRFDAPFRRLSDEPILRFDATGDHVEDPYIWWDGDGYQLIMKDMRGGLCGERAGGVHARSLDGIAWQLSDPPKAYSRTVRWDDGTTTTQAHLERPQLLIESGRPTHLFASTSDAPVVGNPQELHRTWNMVIPLAP